MINASDPSEATSVPPLSVVMPALDAAATIGEALASLAGRAGDVGGLEAIVVDGGSRDATVAVVERFPFARVVTAPGSSIYEALNLAIAAARAPVVAWLNADDLFLPGALGAMLAALDASAEADIVRGRPEFIRSGAEGWQAHDGPIEARAAGPLDLKRITRGPLAINSMLFRRALLSSVGPFDTSLRLSADREWMLRAWRHGARVLELDRAVYRYRVHGGSHTLDPARRGHRRARDEHAVLLDRLLPDALRLDPRDPVRVELRRWHAVETALRLQAAGDWRGALGILGQAGRADPAWPLILAGQMAGLLADRWADRRRR
jgi:glycosyltransferase involved in cell wall biosynthesis